LAEEASGFVKPYKEIFEGAPSGWLSTQR
jgi:hypothetical protein